MFFTFSVLSQESDEVDDFVASVTPDKSNMVSDESSDMDSEDTSDDYYDDEVFIDIYTKNKYIYIKLIHR